MVAASSPLRGRSDKNRICSCHHRRSKRHALPFPSTNRLSRRNSFLHGNIRKSSLALLCRFIVLAKVSRYFPVRSVKRAILISAGFAVQFFVVHVSPSSACSSDLHRLYSNAISQHTQFGKCFLNWQYGSHNASHFSLSFIRPPVFVAIAPLFPIPTAIAASRRIWVKLNYFVVVKHFSPPLPR